MWRASGISRKSEALIVRCSQRKEWISFYCFENPSIAHNFGTTGWIQVGFSMCLKRCTSPNEHFNQIQSWKCHMFNFRLIFLDCIINGDRLTYGLIYCYAQYAHYIVQRKFGTNGLPVVKPRNDRMYNCYKLSCQYKVVICAI